MLDSLLSEMHPLVRVLVFVLLFIGGFSIFIQRMQRHDRSDQRLRELSDRLGRLQDRIEHGIDHRGERAPRTRKRKRPRWKNK